MDPQVQNPSSVPDITNAEAPVVNNAFAQVVEAVQGGKNVLVTVGTNSTVDELSSALGLTFLLGKLDKHATAVFSGEIPHAMEFLDPEKTFERTVDSLRDFIIALDKEKADKLRYKVEDDVVKIFITPYKTIISEKDLEFTQGDFNVDVVVALGVAKREELDKAITAHGRILHDATVITVNAGGKTSNLGSIDWNDAQASSTAEMLVSLSGAFGQDLLDPQISTAFLTGIVAETNRFSNEKTSPKVMSISAQLMAAGANQQLIATNLRQEGMISESVNSEAAKRPPEDASEMVLNHGAKPAAIQTEETPKDVAADQEDAPSNPASEEQHKEAPAVESVTPTEQLKAAVDTASSEVSNENQAEISPESPVVEAPKSQPGHKVIEPLPSLEPDPTPLPSPIVSDPPTIQQFEDRKPMEKPTFGGTLNATTASAEEDKIAQAEREAAVNNTALSHDTAEADSTAQDLEDARKAVEEANGALPFDPANQPLQSINAEPLPSLQPESAVDSSVSHMQSIAAPVPQPAQPEPSPVEAFMQPHAAEPAMQPIDMNAQVAATPVLPPMPGEQNGLPPLPPMPGAPMVDSGLPPLPPLPGQPGLDPAAAFQPQINPAFMQDMPQSQNTWTQAGNDLVNQQAGADAARQQKMDQMNQQYDTAVDRNRELQGLPPLNNPNGSGFPPLPPV
jgi:nanoRNase/pAp phosphatase (c-di-AMP/oligoRNAs hydrolase)